MKQKTVIKHAIELLEKQRTALKEMDLLGVLLENEFAHKSNQINTIQLSLAKLIPIFEEQIENAFVAGSERGTKDIPFNCEQYYSQTFGDVV
mgnify:CR=1 FL=1